MSAEAAAALASGRIEERNRIQAQMDTIVAQMKEDMATKDARVAAKEAHIHALGEQQNALQVEREKEIKAAEQRGQRAAQALLDEKQATIERLEKEKDRINVLLESQIAANTTEVHQLGDVIRRRATNSSIKGRDFEEMMEHVLHSSFRLCAGYELTRTANKGHEADFFTAFKEGRILWEFKNYETAVGSKEIAKLYRDVKDNPGTTIAVMISRYTPIVGHTGSGDMDIEFIDGVMYIYLSRFEFMSEDTLKSLWILFRLWWKNDSRITVDESKQGLMRLITELHERSIKAKSEWRKHKKALEDGVKWMERAVDETEESLRTAIRALEGEQANDVPPGLFNSPKNETETELIQTIVGLTQVDTAGSVELNELAREVAKARSITESTASKHIKAVMLEAVVEARSGKPTRIVGLVMTHQAAL
jgi:DNA polymerase III alpha subunit (gram-positive type)